MTRDPRCRVEAERPRIVNTLEGPVGFAADANELTPPPVVSENETASKVAQTIEAAAFGAKALRPPCGEDDRCNIRHR